MTIYSRRKRHRVTWFGDQENLTWWDQAGPARPRELFEGPSEIRWNVRSGEDLVSASLEGGGEKRDVIVKWRKIRGARLFKGLFRASKAAREFEMGVLLLSRDVPTPKPLLWGELRLCGVVLEEYLVAERVGDASPLPECLWKTARDPAERHRLLEAAGRAVREVHEAGILHGDLNSSNILIQRKGPSCEAMVIDFAGAKDLGSLSDLHREKDLSRFCKSLLPHVREEDKLIFRTAYATRSFS